jgi:hypothetical protein
LSTQENKQEVVKEEDPQRLLIFSMNPPDRKEKGSNVVKLTARFEQIINDQQN